MSGLCHCADRATVPRPFSVHSMHKVVASFAFVGCAVPVVPQVAHEPHQLPNLQGRPNCSVLVTHMKSY